ncbi:hypothetical protein PR048_016466 [Dryococelus australis]|uniref:Reverse transcriptase domain-containing protein n=1 Tax=Dryococelus australis TaxID=614101 RepID=A0ABQ9HJW1_9NEOP|nr:hypothetical protein PR048_016466 [Dryococelus australis]
MKKVDAELDTLEAEGVLTKVETSDWGSPLIVIPKSDGGVHLCVDYKVVDEQSNQIQTISPHRGTYRLHLLSFGIKTTPPEFNTIIDQILHDIPKTVSYFDIIVHGSTREECQPNLIACLGQLQKFDLHLNQQKCSLFQDQIEYLCHVIEFYKI